ncbi:MAG: hypothetical protein HY275_18685 [Gemmatimonadetes bacterium]|nr:hypothetical protein [Gemmatimonadota bacterium]
MATLLLGATDLPSRAVARRDMAPGGPSTPSLASMQGKPKDTLYMALGRKPGWAVIVRRDSIIVNTPNDRGILTFPSVAPKTERGVRSWHVLRESHSFRMILHKLPCTDDKSGKEYPETVDATVDGWKLKGCGGPPTRGKG